MKNRFLITCSRVAIVFLALVGLCICFWWYPFSISLGTVGLAPGELGGAALDTAQAVAFWVQLVFAWLTSLPCFAALALLFKSTVYAGRDEFFTGRNAGVYRAISVIIFIDSMALIAGNTLFMLLKWSPFALIYYVIGALGVIFSLASYLAYRYLESAAAIKEENDSII